MSLPDRITLLVSRRDPLPVAVSDDSWMGLCEILAGVLTYHRHEGHAPWMYDADAHVIRLVHREEDVDVRERVAYVISIAEAVRVAREYLKVDPADFGKDQPEYDDFGIEDE